MTDANFDIVVIGGGPAGLAAAAEAGQAGATVAIIDNQLEAGGQIYRAAERRASPHDPEATHGATLVQLAREAGMQWLGGQSVWQVTPAQEVLCTDGKTARRVRGRRLILATGAQERPMPIPGWTLPGVMTAGAGQILLKSAKTVPTGDVWLAGSGPLLLLLASQWLAAGVALRGILDTTPRGNIWSALPYLPAALPAWRELLRGLRWRNGLRYAGIPWHRVTGGLRAVGQDRLECVAWQTADQQQEYPADALFLHQGVIPHARLLQSMGGAMHWDEAQACFTPVVDHWYASSIPNVAVVGDSGGIAGAGAAETQGRLGALAALFALGVIDTDKRDARARPLRRQLARQLCMRSFLDAAFAPAPNYLIPPDPSVTVCRCECVTLSQVRIALDQGAHTVQEVKLATRCAMGPCQGRQCATTLNHIVTQFTGATQQPLKVRSPAEPVTLGAWAELYDE
jgi:thioredoxin reductase/bacterioferritin-associated ferredoxin